MTSKVAPSPQHLTFDEARELISSKPETLIHSPLIEAEAFYRLRNYPAQIKESLHHAVITIPRKLAYILHERPASIAAAVEAFYLRDPIALKALQKDRADLLFAPDDLVTVSVRFTKILYAQVKSQQFPPLEPWKEVFASERSNTLSDKKYDQLEIGMKLAAGYEMLLQDKKNADSRLVREIKILLEDLELDGDSALPTDEEILKWPDVAKTDDESWLDINYEDFEKELQGKREKTEPSSGPKVFGPERPPGFGDSRAQADLKKIVERFEAFMNDEEAGAEGAEFDAMDFDDDEEEDDEDDEDSDEEDKAVSFDEAQFTRMMREMMGMPLTETDKEASDSAMAIQDGHDIKEIDSEKEQNKEEDEEIRKLMEGMEAELKLAGALNLDPTPDKHAKLQGKSPTSPKENTATSHETDDESEGELDIDFNLAKNLLESFKSQGGMAGPGGNLLGLMGMQLPRDEDDT